MESKQSQHEEEFDSSTTRVQEDIQRSDHRSSTPVAFSGEQPADTSLTTLEAAPRVATSSRTQLPGLLPTSNPDQETSMMSSLLPEDDNVSSICEVSARPSVEPKFRFLTGLSDSKKTAQEIGLINCPKPLRLYTHTF